MFWRKKKPERTEPPPPRPSDEIEKIVIEPVRAQEVLNNLHDAKRRFASRGVSSMSDSDMDKVARIFESITHLSEKKTKASGGGQGRSI